MIHIIIIILEPPGVQCMCRHTSLISCMFVYMFASIQEIQRRRIQPETAFPAQEDLFIQDRLRLC